MSTTPNVSAGADYRCPDGLTRFVAAGDEVPAGWKLEGETAEVAGVTTSHLQAADEQLNVREKALAEKEAAVNDEIARKQTEFDERDAALTEREEAVTTRETEAEKALAEAKAAKAGDATKAKAAPAKRTGTQKPAGAS